ncbi:MAG TPA: histidine phosphatase family protein [Bacillota bacterium]|nr:histidine phosphatase family protein [Bacillota bacterium]HPF42424.1 histidine phosphatase family protein [Bacillota bacterium]HPJ85443.1 histidine phosphatase family protein [Bacillota bacterium]HPQ61261.1 histidine phosphatase family protein [Bacillota bacterium]HRX91659.1 histidine phosphatase family protein [Candidatus Izemoplasmatales bacterium]
MNELILIRHGETDANRNYVVQGRFDNPLNEYGMKQALETGKFLRQRKEKIDLVFSSPLKRAFMTARLILEGMQTKKSIIVHQNLIERNFGDYDGQKITDEYADLIKHGTIPNMEKNEDLELRVFETLQEICEKYPGKKIMVVTHSHVIKAILVRLVPGFTYASYLSNCSINYLRYSNGEFFVRKYNISPITV